MIDSGTLLHVYSWSDLSTKRQEGSASLHIWSRLVISFLLVHKQHRPSELQGCDERFHIKSTFADWSSFSAKLQCCAENQSTADRQPEQVKCSVLFFGFSQFRVDVPVLGRLPEGRCGHYHWPRWRYTFMIFSSESPEPLHAGSSLVSTLLELILAEASGLLTIQLSARRTTQIPTPPGWQLTSMHSSHRRNSSSLDRQNTG